MVRILAQLGISTVFLLANVLILLIILHLNRRPDSKAKPTKPAAEGAGQQLLDPAGILGREFEYARTTASEAVGERHTLVNFYLLAVGIVASGVVAVLGQDADLPSSVGTVLLWLLCAIGWFDFLAIIRLRQAWHDSARTMNQIKDFYVEHAKDFEPNVLQGAFRWKTETLPRPDKPWTVFFYSAALIGLLNSVAYATGGVLLSLDAAPGLFRPAVVLLALLGLAFFGFHVWLYFAFLRPDAPSDQAASNAPRTAS
jgi:hypothetical protein